MANLSSFDLNLLRVLDALLRENSTVRAAAALGLSQPAVSAALGRLRISLGDELFFRSGQGLEPTHFALSLKTPLHETLDRIESLIKGPLAFDPATSNAGIRISGNDFFAELLMPQLAQHLEDKAPSMRVHLVDLVADNYLESLERYEVDLALMPRADFPDWVESQTIFHSSFQVVARQDHPRLRKAGVSPGDVMPLDLFCELGHVLFSPEGKSRALADAALAQIGRQRRIVMTMAVFSGVYRAVAGSDLIALIPTALAHKVASSENLSIYAPPIPVPSAEITMVWRRRYARSHAHSWMRTQITNLLHPLIEPN